MQNESNKKRFAGKGYYIALIACIAAVGISGYVFVQTARDSAVETAAVVSLSPTAPTEAVESPAQSPAADTDTETGADAAQTQDMGDSYEETMAETSLSMGAAIWPLEGDVTATFSQDTLTYSETMADWRTHEGLDIAAAQGELVYAVQDGEVTAVYEDDYLGSVVVVSHAGEVSTLYANLTKTPSVTVGETVSAGAVIGQVGNTALLETMEADHLHFEVYKSGNPVDPYDYLP